MRSLRPLLRLEDKLAEEQRLLERITRSPDRGLAGAALLVAVAVHAAFLAAPLPRVEAFSPGPAANPQLPVVWRAMPQPTSSPPVAAPVHAASSPLRLSARPVGFALVPIPNDPVLESEPEPASWPAMHEPEPLIGVPVPPAEPTAGPEPGSTRDTPPRLIPEFRVEPEFPSLARARRVGGVVTSEALVLASGRVGDVRVLECTRPGLGLETAAMRAVRQWRYVPATRGGIPTEAWVSVKVDFSW